MKAFVLFIVGIIATFALISFATRIGEGESTLGAIGIPQGQANRIIAANGTPLPTRQILNFVGSAVSCEDTLVTTCTIETSATATPQPTVTPESISFNRRDTPTGGAAVNTGTGANVHSPRVWQVSTGATSGSTSLSRTSVNQGWQIGIDDTTINWGESIHIEVIFAQLAHTTAGKSVFSLGRSTDNTVGGCVNKCIGFIIESNAISSLTHDGSNQFEQVFTKTISDSLPYKMVIHCDGTCVFDLSDASSTETKTEDDIPTGSGTAGFAALQIDVSNNADSAAQTLVVHQLTYSVYSGIE